MQFVSQPASIDELSVLCSLLFVSAWLRSLLDGRGRKILCGSKSNGMGGVIMMMSS